MRAWVVICAALGCFLVPQIAAASESCHDGKLNGPESDVDCGGDCPACAVGKACRSARDCSSGLCAEGVCQERSVPRGEAAPPGYETRGSSADPGATARRAGILFFGIGYGAAYVSALALPGELSWMYAPVLGPWLSLGNLKETEYKALLIADGVFQAGGAALILGGVASSGSQLIRAETTARVIVTPHVHPRGAGLGVVGHF